jgi:6-phosphogluconate dehydrogenase
MGMGISGGEEEQDMVHNGIEYGIMQLISESYAVMKLAFDLSDDELQSIYGKWNKGRLNGFLLEITSNIFGKVDENSGKRFIDEILDVARQKGTGMWTSQSVMELQVPVPTIEWINQTKSLNCFRSRKTITPKKHKWDIGEIKDRNKGK